MTLRRVPETKKEFAQLTAPELKSYAAEFQANKLKVSLLKTTLGDPDGFAAAVSAAQALGAGKIGVRVESAPAIGQLASIAEAAKIRLLIEDQPPRALKALLDAVPSKWVGFTWDPGEGFVAGRYALLPKPRMFNVEARSESLSDGPEPAELAGESWRRCSGTDFRAKSVLKPSDRTVRLKKHPSRLETCCTIAGEVG